MRALAAAAVCLLGVCAAASPAGAAPLRVLAAASLRDVLPRVEQAWRAAGGAEVRFVFDATSRLARQVVAGAPGDLFFSADRRWMDHLEAHGRIVPGSRLALLANRIVLAVPRQARSTPAGPTERAGPGRDRRARAAEAAPAGRYATEALRATGVWERVSRRVVRGGSVRTALAWIARGEAAAGVVYATDVRADPKTRAAFVFSATSHTPVLYPAALLDGAASPASAERFLTFCSSAAAWRLFEEAGFSRPVAQ